MGGRVPTRDWADQELKHNFDRLWENVCVGVLEYSSRDDGSHDASVAIGTSGRLGAPPAIMRLQIPASDRVRFRKLLELDSVTFDQLETEFERSSPTLMRADLVKALSCPAGISEQELGEIVTVLLNLHMVRAGNGMTALEVARSVIEAAKRETEDATIEPLPAPKVGWDEFERRLAKLLSFDKSLGVTAKALVVAYESAQQLHAVRVLTDARPVFAEASEGPAAFVILHTLKLEVHTAQEDTEYFVTLNSYDLTELKEAVDRALIKQESLQKALLLTNIPVLKWRAEDNA